MVMAHAMAVRVGRLEKARLYLTDWLALHPDDEGVRTRLQEYERQLDGSSAGGQ